MMWSCTELLRYGIGARLAGEALPEPTIATLRCEPGSSVVIIELPTEWDAFPDAEFVQRIELAGTGAGEDAEAR